MKKSSAIVLAIVLIIASQGWMVARHFCGGVQVSSELAFLSPDESCCGDEMPETGCCSNIIDAIGLDDEFITSAESPHLQVAIIELIAFSSFGFRLDSSQSGNLFSEKDPPLHRPPIRELISCFRL